MGKDDRYDLGGADDGLGGSDSDTSTQDLVEVEEESADESGSNQDSSSTTTSTEPDEIPHRVRYDGPKEGRSAKTVYLAPEDEQRLDELGSLANAEFDETVYDLDVYIAGARAGLRNSEDAFLEEMREIGYGYFD